MVLFFGEASTGMKQTSSRRSEKKKSKQNGTKPVELNQCRHARTGVVEQRDRTRVSLCRIEGGHGSKIGRGEGWATDEERCEG